MVDGIEGACQRLVIEFADRFRRTPAGWRFSERRGRLLLHT